MLIEKIFMLQQSYSSIIKQKKTEATNGKTKYSKNQKKILVVLIVSE